MVLREPERFEGYLVCNMAHPWLSARAVLPHLWRFVYQLPLATFGVTVQRRTPYVERVIFVVGSRMDRDSARVFAERFRDPVCAKAGRDTYRTFLTQEIPHGARNPETRRISIPIRVLYGTGDFAVAPSFIDPETVKADDYTVEAVDASHFVVDERPDLVRKKLIALAEETA
jgi:pimeloyl-ACP methyl ester carboxylesterase